TLGDVSVGPEALDSQIEALTQTLHALEHRLHSRIGDAKKRRNRFSAIHRLPVETLVEIFRISLSDAFGTEAYYPRLARMSTVCTFWATIVDKAPTLWTSICGDDKPSLVARALAKSGDCSLSVFTRAYSPVDFFGRKSSSLSSFLDQVGPQVHRWQDADLFVASDISIFQKDFLLEASAPRLRKLRIIVNVPSPSEHRIDVFRGKAERLRELEIAGAPLQWSSSLLAGLHVLRITDIRDGMNVTQLLAVLQGCPDLTELGVQRCSMLQTDPSELPERVDLPHLQHLELTHLSPSNVVFEVLPRIFTPKYERFRISSPFVETATTKTISHVYPALSQLVSSVAQIDLAISYNNFKFTEGSPGFRKPLVDIHVYQSQPLELLNYMATTFSQAMKGVETSISLGDFFDKKNAKDFVLIDGVPLVTTINAYSRRDVSGLLTHLSTPTVINGTKRWPHPHLQCLSLYEESCDPETLLKMVQSRYGVAKAKGKGKHRVELPVPLESLEVTGQGHGYIQGTIFEKVEEIVGREHTVWHTDDELEEDMDEDEYGAEEYDYYSDPYEEAYDMVPELWDYF
ncbi:hypothetical protein FRB99_005841, partial [Tulasnella sp. 403]